MPLWNSEHEEDGDLAENVSGDDEFLDADNVNHDALQIYTFPAVGSHPVLIHPASANQPADYFATPMPGIPTMFQDYESEDGDSSHNDEENH